MRLVLALAVALAAGPALAQVVSARPDAVAVVMYQERPPNWSDDDDGDPGLAAITETRTLDLPAGRSRVAFQSVADGIVPQTAALQGLPGQMIERNFDFDLLTPGALIEKAVNGPARLVRTNPKTGQSVEIPVTVRAGPDGIVLQQADGTAEALGCSGLPERLVFDHAPPGLAATPTLSVLLDTPRAGRYRVTLSYVATGLKWGADYVIRIRPDGRTLALTGWLTLRNRGSTTFGHAPTQVVAGRLQRVEDADVAPVANLVSTTKSCWPVDLPRQFAPPPRDIAPPPPMASPAIRSEGLQEVVVTATRQATVSNLGDYKLYTLPEPTTVAAKQTKQVAFLDRPDTPFQRVFQARTEAYVRSDDIQPANIVLRLMNRKEAGLGAPLPGGQVNLFEPAPDGRVRFVGQDRIRDTPIGLPVEIVEGQSPDVTVTRHLVREQQVKYGNEYRKQAQVELTVANASGEPAATEILLYDQDGKIVAESLRHVRKGPNKVWAFTVPAGGQQVLRYTAEE